ncbi:RsfA family transcriptional regulator [Alteribacter natronophilus]|uniref:RsfA family transcriptional regulator n=1 Tax=Alteribacter natronophilus TaxID=2583810 RepID=UPI00110D8B1D|nr:RsfA family transcriptional regulator [Alteribacter natronophilus]TMW73959.1 RsfA family transcriptional regulator [Alteribacter natronophilus]
MMKVRQDAWSQEDDLLLAETVLRHIREGSTQLNAFDEVGDALNRTSAACGFRWNAVVRNKYDDAIKLAKKHRKERKRRQANEARPSASGNRIASPPPSPDYHQEPVFEAETSSELQSTGQETGTVVQTEASEEMAVAPVMTSQLPRKRELNLTDVIDFLERLAQNNYMSATAKVENDRLVRENDRLNRKVAELEEKLKELEQEHKVVEEDYQSIIQIMNRARRMALLEEEDSEDRAAPAFKMDKNGNLEKIAK